MTVANHAELISFKGFSKTFVTKAGDLRAATYIELAVRQGEFVTLVGPCGWGKPANDSAGLFPPTDGQALYQGKPISGYNNCMERTTKGLLRC